MALIAPGGRQINFNGQPGEESHDLNRRLPPKRTDFFVREMAEVDGTDGRSEMSQGRSADDEKSPFCHQSAGSRKAIE
jgi:hypothetical protein